MVNLTVEFCIQVVFVNVYDEPRGRYSIFQNGGGGGGGCCHGYGNFILGHFVKGQIMQCMDKTPADKMLVDKTPIKISGEDKTLAILWDRKDKMPILSKHLLYRTVGPVN